MKRKLAWLPAIGALVAAYVAYSHFASVRELEISSHEFWHPFVSNDELTKFFSVRHAPSLTSSMKDGALAITNRGPVEAGDELVLSRTEPFRLEAGLLVGAVRLNTKSPVDVFVGFESVVSPHRLALALSNNPDHPTLRLLGDIDPVAPHAQTNSVIEPYLELHLGDLDAGSHMLGIRFDATRMSAEAYLDLIPVGSSEVRWRAGTEARVVIGVRAREGNVPVDVRLESLRWEPAPGGAMYTRGTDVIDEFIGGRVDPLRWDVSLINDWRHTGLIEPAKSGAGLELVAHVEKQVPTPPAHPAEICLAARPLSPIRVLTEWSISDLRFARAYVVVRNKIGNRILEAAMTSTSADGALSGTMSGEVNDKRAIDSRPAVPINGPADVTLGIVFDPWTRLGRGEVNGQSIGQARYDMRRNELVRVCVGVQVAPGGTAKATLRTFQFHAAPY